MAGGILEMALVADGVSPANLYPLDVERALAKLGTLRGNIIWWSEGAQSQQLLQSDETPLAMVWTGRAVSAAKTAPVSIQWNQWTSQNGWWVVPKGVPNKDLCMRLLKFSTSPEAQANFTRYEPYGPTNRLALPKVSAQYRDNLPTSHLQGKITLDNNWWAANYDSVNTKFQAWLTS